ncbi:fungal-specific transcription factor domain-containing protein [Cadophora sp. MPI-SDFR-AT-0126]|nr:fungal-specific transcription factor domain-containing protein [Leotiomycetes sp. MPI-SDFR-AT-0126]
MDNSTPAESTGTETEYVLGEYVLGENNGYVAHESTSVDPSKASGRKRLSRACDRCRSRKVKCDLRRPTCANCEIRSFDCGFFLPSQKRGRKRRVALPAHEDTNVATAEHRQPSPTTSSGSFRASCDTANTIHSRGEQTTYSSSPGLTENDAPPGSQISAIICSLENVINKNNRSQTLASLATQCIDVFFDCLYPLMPIIYRPKVDAAISQIHNQNSGNDASLLALLTSVCAVTIAVLPKTIFAAKAEVGVHFYRASREVLNTYVAEDHEHPDSTSVIIRYLYAEFHHATGKMRSSWHNLGDAIRICQGMRLHDESSYTHMNHSESELCRRIFFLLFVGDKSASILSNHPVTMGKFSLDGGITVLYPHSFGEVDSITCSNLDPEDDRLNLLTGFMFNYELWRSVYILLCEIEWLRDRFLSRPGFESSQQHATLADVSRLTELYLDFQTSLDALPSGLQAHPTLLISPSSVRFEDTISKNRGSKILAIQRANLLVSFQCLRMAVLHAMPALGDSMSPLWWSGPNQNLASKDRIDPTIFESAKEVRLRSSESSALLLQRISIAESMLHIVCSCSLDDLRINGESCVAKIRLIGATMLELIDNNPNSPLVRTAQKFRDSYPRILAHLDSKTSDSV